MRKTIIKNIFGGRLVLLLSARWKLVLYVFFLVLLYITIHYDVNESALKILDNEQTIKELKADFTRRCSDLQELTTAERTGRMLEERRSELRKPDVPPVPVKNDTMTP